MKLNYYEILGVDRSASTAEIRNQFRKLARENHPDRYRGPDKAEVEKKFQTLTEAMNVLTDDARRKQHDSELAVPANKGVVDFVQIAKKYMSIGVTAYKDKNYPLAYENFDMAVKHNPQDAKGFHYLALTATRIPGYTRQAVQAIEAAVQREPMNASYLKDAGLMCRKAGLVAKAERYLDEALKWDSSNVEVQMALAEIRQDRNDAKEAGKGFSLFRKN